MKMSCFSILFIICLTIFFPLSASAARAPGFESTPYDRTDDMDFIDSVTLEDELGNDLSDPANSDIPLDAVVTLTYNFSIDNTEDVIEGDTFELHIPVEIYVENPGGYDLATSSGLVIAHYTLSTNGTILFTFTDAIQSGSLSNVWGDFWFES